MVLDLASSVILTRPAVVAALLIIAVIEILPKLLAASSARSVERMQLLLGPLRLWGAILWGWLLVNELSNILAHPLLAFFKSRWIEAALLLAALGAYELAGAMKDRAWSLVARGLAAGAFYYALYLLSAQAVPELLEPVVSALVVSIIIGAVSPVVYSFSRAWGLRLGLSTLRIGAYVLLLHSAYLILSSLRTESPRLYALGLAVIGSIVVSALIDRVYSVVNGLGGSPNPIKFLSEHKRVAEVREDEFFLLALERATRRGRAR